MYQTRLKTKPTKIYDMKTLKAIIVLLMILTTKQGSSQISYYLNNTGINEIEESTINLKDSIYKPRQSEYGILTYKIMWFGLSRFAIRFWSLDGKKHSKRYIFKTIISQKVMSVNHTKSGDLVFTEHLTNKHLGECTIVTDKLDHVLMIYGDTRKKNEVLYYDYAE